MDKLTAYQILGLDNSASRDEVKEAYARLSKEYHPEDNPQAFQLFHEAYVTLTRKERRNANHAMETEPSPIVKNVISENKESDLIFSNIKKEVQECEKEQAQSDFDFDASIQKAEDEEQKKEWLIFVQADKELKTIFATAKYKNPDKVKAFFERKEYENVFCSKEFIASLTQCLCKRKLLPEIYSYLIKFYRLKVVEFESLEEELQRLYEVIDCKYDIKKDIYDEQRHIEIRYIISIILFVFFPNRGRVNRILETDAYPTMDIIISVIPYILIAGLGFCLYRSFRRRHSTYLAQAMVAGIFLILGIVPFCIFAYWYGTTHLLLSKLALSFSVVFLCINVDWLIILGIVVLRQWIRKRRKMKKG